MAEAQKDKQNVIEIKASRNQKVEEKKEIINKA